MIRVLIKCVQVHHIFRRRHSTSCHYTLLTIMVMENSKVTGEEGINLKHGNERAPNNFICSNTWDLWGAFESAFKVERRECKKPSRRLPGILTTRKEISAAEETGKKGDKEACVICLLKEWGKKSEQRLGTGRRWDPGGRAGESRREAAATTQISELYHGLGW